MILKHEKLYYYENVKTSKQFVYQLWDTQYHKYIIVGAKFISNAVFITMS